MFINKTESGKNNICGPAIRDLRKQRGLSQRELADALLNAGIDINKNAIQRIESGKRFVTDIELAVMCNFFEISSDELLVHNNSNN